MDEIRYLDFDLLIERAGEGYTARVLNSPAGQATADFRLPFSELELENFLLRVGRTRRGVRRLESPEMEAAKTLGGRLFRAVFDDEIGRYSYPVDIHPAGTDEADFEKFKDEWENMRLGRGENYGIPYRCLVPQKLTNVLVAGRCISADRYMQSSVRVMPACYITGQAAGTAAALAAENDTNTRGFDVKELQKRLKNLR